jgi:hypothetical protein
MGFFAWLRRKTYSTCTDDEKTYIHVQVKEIIERAERTTLHLIVPSRQLQAVRLADGTPVDLTIYDFAAIAVEQKYITTAFIINYGVTALGDYVLHFVCGGAGGGAGYGSMHQIDLIQIEDL